MKVKALLLTILLTAALPFAGCGGKPDYGQYVSEERTNIYIYEEDGLSLKIMISDRESPYNADGYKGEMCRICEAVLNLAVTPDRVELLVGGKGGEMSYMSVSKSFYLSFADGELTGESLSVGLTIDGKERTVTATSVLYDGLITTRQALDCVTEYAADLFASLTEGRSFAGEIHLRLLYDEGCFYYVGVCDRQGNTNAYLVDSENGRIIAQRTIHN